MAYELDCSGVFRVLAQFTPDMIVFASFVVSVLVLESLLDLRSSETRPFVRMKRQKYSQLDNMTKRCRVQTDKDACLTAFDTSMQLSEISAITYAGQRTTNFRHDCLIRMAYFMALSACTQICSCMVPQTLFAFDEALKNTVHYKTAVSSMYLLAELLTVPNYSTQYKLRNVEKAALGACAALCKKQQDMLLLSSA